MLPIKKYLLVIAILLCANVVIAQTNYIRSWEAVAPQTNPGILLGLGVKDVKQSTQYIDGLGRVVQSVIKQGSYETGATIASDMVAPVVLDDYGRETSKYLPYVEPNLGANTSSNNGLYKPNPLPTQAIFAASQYPGESYFYSLTNMEPSPLNRPVKSMPVGDSWVGSNRGQSIRYLTNTLLDDVKIWTVTEQVSSLAIYSTIPTVPYEPATLTKTITADENNKQVIEFKDKEGKVILKKVQLSGPADNGAGIPPVGNGGDWLCTYYIYDIYNNLRCVIQPEGVKLLPTNGYQLTTVLLAEQCFRYDYDQRNRMIKKKVPGAGEVWMIYDARDRLVLTQDANMRSVTQKKWLYTKYDELNRPQSTGFIMDPTYYNDFSYHFNAAYGSINYPDLSLYTTREELSTTFYDNYNWLASYSTGLSATYNSNYDTYFQPASNSNWPYPQANVKSEQVKGMPTGSRTKVIPPVGGGGATYLYSIAIYNEKGRTIQSQSTNITGGVDIATTQYTWAGQPLVTISKQQALPLAGGVGGGLQETVTVTQLNYDDLGRAIKTEKKLSNTLVNGGAMAAYKTIAENKYDKLGQLVNKNLGTKPTATAPLAKLDYEYNIRGWLTSVNKNFVTAGNTGANNDEYFGMQLGYDKDGFGPFAKKQYNGNIAGSIWRSAGDGIDRKYDYDYDAANRLLKADFTQHNGVAFVVNTAINFDVKMGNGVDPNAAYDYNGNIKQMQQWGLKINSSTLIDNLVYEYNTNSNRLAKVTDQGISTTDNGKLGDFKDGTNANDDYFYDDNGNLNIDNNKNIGNITYNHLNLPQVITIPNKGTITYSYDAGGNKLKKVTQEDPTIANGNKTITTTTNYISGLVYESKTTSPPNTPTTDYTDVLQFVPQEEGRIRFKPAVGAIAASFAYDYILKDHLGNVRVVITEEQQQDIYPAATLEDATYNGGTAICQEQKFYDINPAKVVLRAEAIGIPNYTNQNIPAPPNNNPNSNTTANSAKLYKLNSTSGLPADKMGLGITLKVMAGDRIDVAGKSYYFQQTAGQSGNSTLPLTDILTGFLGGASGAGATSVHGAVSVSQINPGATNPTINNLLNTQTTQSNNTPSNPRAFINVIFFDEQFNAIDFRVSKVGDANVLKENHLQDLQNLVASKNGFVYVYVSNESPVSVFFDNVQVVHTRGAMLEETHYYPFGLVMSGISSKAAGSLSNKRKYSGKELQSSEFSDGSGLELNDFGRRMQDPQIGRWHVVDPLSDVYVGQSTYNYVLNNPLIFKDPDGMKVVVADKGQQDLMLGYLTDAFGADNGFSFNKKGELSYSKKTDKNTKSYTKEQKALLKGLRDVADNQEYTITTNIGKDGTSRYNATLYQRKVTAEKDSRGIVIFKKSDTEVEPVSDESYDLKLYGGAAFVQNSLFDGKIATILMDRQIASSLTIETAKGSGKYTLANEAAVFFHELLDHGLDYITNGNNTKSDTAAKDNVKYHNIALKVLTNGKSPEREDHNH